MLGCAHNEDRTLKIMGVASDAHRCLFEADVQSNVVVHAALLPLMLVAAPSQTTLSQLKRSAPQQELALR
jgi:hypothetical protein